MILSMSYENGTKGTSYRYGTNGALACPRKAEIDRSTSSIDRLADQIDKIDPYKD